MLRARRLHSTLSQITTDPIAATILLTSQGTLLCKAMTNDCDFDIKAMVAIGIVVAESEGELGLLDPLLGLVLVGDDVATLVAILRRAAEREVAQHARARREAGDRSVR